MKLAIIGMGYVGLPLAVAFSKFYKTKCFDINKERIKELKNKIDSNFLVKKKEFNDNLLFYDDLLKIKDCNIYIVCVPTPVSKNNKPNLKPLENSINDISKIIEKKNIIIVESTVYPGVTRKIVTKIFSKNKKFTLNKDYYLGYSPERINPGDKTNSLNNISKIVSCSSIVIKNTICNLYKKICNKIEYVEKIEIAEAAKVIENVQRDINIALMNELWSLFKMHTDIDFNSILKAAASKWNFIKFQPGMVGGHCIPVDPYYLAEYAKKNKFNTKFILQSRKINNSFHKEIINYINIRYGRSLSKFKCLILGLSYKSNVADIRNTQCIKFIKNFSKYTKKIDYYDPYVKNINIKTNTKCTINQIKSINTKKKYDLIIQLVNHDFFTKNKKLLISKLNNKNNLFKL